MLQKLLILNLLELFCVYTLNPSGLLPPDYEIECKIKNGRKFDISIYNNWSPNGAKRFVDLVKDQYYDNTAIFRCQKNITIQYGIPPDKTLQKKWFEQGI